MEVLEAETDDPVGAVLAYVAVGGTAALVDLTSRNIIRVVGGGRFPIVDEAAAMLASHPDPIRDLGHYLVGRVGPDHAIVLRKGDVAMDPIHLKERMHRACATLCRRLRRPPTSNGSLPPGESPPSGNSGSPAEAIAVPPHRRGSKRHDSS